MARAGGTSEIKEGGAGRKECGEGEWVHKVSHTLPSSPTRTRICPGPGIPSPKPLPQHRCLVRQLLPALPHLSVAQVARQHG